MSSEVNGSAGQDFLIPPTRNLPGLVVDIQPLPSPFRAVTVFSPSAHPDFTEEYLVNGFGAEKRVGELLGGLVYVDSVRQSIMGGEDDSNLVDLVVTMVDSFAIPWVNVQVKSSEGGNRRFYGEVARKMKKEGKPLSAMGEQSHDEKIRWMQDKRLVLINGGTKGGENVSDAYIIRKFISQVAGIVRREREVRMEQLGGYLRAIADNSAEED